MYKTIDFDSVADIYDLYVNTSLDIDFFINECSKVSGEILELMCGTGRVSIPLLEKGFKLTCLDYMEKMLDIFKEKIKEKWYNVEIIKMDVSELDLKRRYKLIFIPFNSYSEITDSKKQISTLEKINNHLSSGGKFICTLHNPVKRLLIADGKIHKIGRFRKNENQILEVFHFNRYDEKTGIIKGEQYYELYDNENIIEKRKLEINFRLYEKAEFEKMILDSGFKIETLYGNYDYSVFKENESPYMIWILRKK